MSSIVVAGDTSGSVTLSAPAVSGSTVLTLPATTATLLTDSSGVLNIGSGQIYKDASGNVGIGTSSPKRSLSINGGLTFQAPGGANRAIHWGDETTSIFPVTLSAGTLVGNEYFSIGTNVFGSPAIERMRIDSSGNVGIGTTSPSSFGKFAVVGSNTGGAIVNYFCNSWTTATANTQVVLSLDAGGNGYGVRDSQIKATNNGANQTTLEFYTANAATPAERMRIDSSGNLLVGTTSLPIAGTRVGISGALSYVNTGSATRKWSQGPDGNGNFVVFNDASVGVFIAYGGTSWGASSDERLKTDLIPIENGLEKVNSLRSVTGRFKTDEEGVSRSFLIAQDVQKVLPEAVSVQDDEIGTLGVAYTEVIPLLVASIKELKAIIDTQQEQINSLLGK